MKMPKETKEQKLYVYMATHKKELDALWYSIQDSAGYDPNTLIPLHGVAIKDLGKEFRKRAKKKGYSQSVINEYLKNW
jgi:hypothetical protein